MKIRQRTWTKRAAAILSLVAVTLPMATNVAQASTTAQLAPQRAVYGYFMDTYKQNVSTYKTAANNPMIGMLAEFSNYYADGKNLNKALMQENIDKSAQITQNRTPAEEERSYLTDRRDLRYSVINALGPYAPAFIKNANAQTPFHKMPNTPDPVNQKHAHVDWADENAKLGPIVAFMNHNSYTAYSNTGIVKSVVRYKRPYRWSTDVKPLPALSKIMAAAPATDFDFASGHTTTGFEDGLSLAYAFPERFQELLTRSSEIGLDRVIAGRHSPLAVMGGRMAGSAVVASALNNFSNQDMMKKAYDAAHSADLLGSKDASAQDDFADYQKNREDYRYRMTYGFKQIGNPNVDMHVPKGAEALLATRLPYLTDTQRRDVLFTTGMPSGYPLMDDAEGWGRLDLFSAASGYGKFNDAVTVKMNAAKGGFNAQDNWRNDISGKGSLIKAGSGSLQLSGDNTYAGGVSVKGGTLRLASATAAGKGNVQVKRGALQLSAQKVTIKGRYQQAKNGQLSLAKTARLAVKKNAQLAGTLKLTAGRLKNGATIMTFRSHKGKFAHVTGLSKGWHVVYTKHAVKLVK
ncbi:MULTISPECIES: autotransporter-associated beta strand repeat-containing protein [Lactobacillaceae]|uniref:autotransporter-associated beta strand repeat-containing protein n=1 Tax=Lactobacillaceae TaxID=33958 RepID=UPI00145788EE|nr:autotransporter-associated beta strand repeat-containing protein [Lactobacillus sp. HBUAS51381]NLR09163.1 phosphatase PAP2 family protein [Lactobacillus sp. HBUAS51381]